MLSNLILLLSLLLSSKLYSIPEQTLETQYQNLLNPFFQNFGVEGTLKTKDEINLKYKYFINPNEVGAIVIVSGRSESMFKYDELAFDFYHMGYTVYLFDLRGQGQSDRLIENRSLGHVDSFDDYVADLATYMNKIVLKRNSHKLFAVSHSMGGNILAQYSVQYPKVFDKIVVSAPLFEMKTGSYPPAFAYAILKMMKIMGKGEDPVFAKPVDDSNSYVGTHSLVRAKKKDQQRDLFEDEKVNDPTNSWVLSSLEATWKVQRNAKDLKTPMLILQAGQDELVSNRGQDKVCSEAQYCEKVVFPTAHHEILLEQDAIRNRAIDTIKSFFNHPTPYRTTENRNQNGQSLPL